MTPRSQSSLLYPVRPGRRRRAGPRAVTPSPPARRAGGRAPAPTGPQPLTVHFRSAPATGPLKTWYVYAGPLPPPRAPRAIDRCPVPRCSAAGRPGRAGCMIPNLPTGTRYRYGYRVTRTAELQMMQQKTFTLRSAGGGLGYNIAKFDGKQICVNNVCKLTGKTFHGAVCPGCKVYRTARSSRRWRLIPHPCIILDSWTSNHLVLSLI